MTHWMTCRNQRKTFRPVRLSILSYGRLFLTLMVIECCIMGDYLLSLTSINASNFYRAIVDNGTHGLVGLLLWAIVVDPTFFPPRELMREPLLWEIILSGVFSSLLDLDHFMTAKSVKLKEALSLHSRPLFHATTLIPVVSLILVALYKLSRSSWLRHLPLIFMVAWFSHHLRDASRRGMWFWPWGSTPPLPYWLYILATAILPYVVIICMNMTRSTTYCRYSSKQLNSINGCVQHV